MVVEVLTGIELHRIAESKILQARWQLFGARHPRIADQYRNNRDAATQRSFNLDANRIGFFLDSFVGARYRAKPGRPNDREQDVG